MVASTSDIVIAGGGLAAVRTAQGVRDFGFGGSITIVSDEAATPYDRPPLSKAYLLGKAGADDICLASGNQLAELGVQLHLGSPVVGLDRATKQLLVGAGERLGYARLVVATGARPHRLVGLEGRANVHVLRTMADADALRHDLRPGARIGIVGAGFIGLEIAAVAVSLGCEVTVFEATAAPLASILGAEVAACVQRWHERRGVGFRCASTIAHVEADPTVRTLHTTDGSSVPVDAVVVGIGQRPNVEWLAGSGLELAPGLVCDEHGRTLDPAVFGLGDATCVRIGQRPCRPSRHWTATTEQARRVAALLCGKLNSEPVIHDNYFWSDQHGLRLTFAGDIPPNPRLAWLRGGPEADRFAVAYCNESDEICAIFTVGSPMEFLTHSEPIRAGRRVRLESV